MSDIEWIETTVGEYCPFIYGKALPQSKRISGNIPVYGSNGIVDFHNSSCVNTAGVIIGRKGSVGAIHLSEKPFWAIDTAFYIVNDDLEELKFTYYLLKTLGLSEMNSDSAVPGLNRENAHSLKIKIPKDKFHRCEIGKRLSIFDQKIQLNTQINQTLEQIAQALFRSWFVDFEPVRTKVQALSEGMSLEQAELAAMQTISGKTPEELTALSQTQPEHYAELAETTKAFPCEMVEIDGVEVPKGWEKTTLSEICEMQNGYAFKSSDWMEQGIPVIKIGSVKPMIVEVEGNGFVSEDYSKLKPDFLLTSGDILVGLTGYVGEVGRIPTGKNCNAKSTSSNILTKRDR
ncbi:putative type I restriction enzyme HindVIIP specificity protein [Haemophilus influenzae]|uniref:Putative type I restriction enzyme HindVIIP specificity protein n=1 Tax=Haemophilus influenzae TaxID=727 RepID=A0A2X1PZR6_HAEIF|nr:putative type I restriction enzyme HindVIIP specificity protein [Haemophilus influenzae]